MINFYLPRRRLEQEQELRLAELNLLQTINKIAFNFSLERTTDFRASLLRPPPLVVLRGNGSNERG